MNRENRRRNELTVIADGMGDVCCPPGSLPALAEDTTREVSGTVSEVGGLTIYYVAPPAPIDRGILVIYDVHGFSGGRIKGVCDTLAAAGFHVAMPDVYKGENIGMKGGLKDNPAGRDWLKGHTEWSTLGPALDPALGLLRAKGATKLGAVGFCWGAYGVFKLSADSKIAAGVSCHPSIKLGQEFFGESVEAQAAAAKCAMCMLPAGNDPEYYTDGTLSKIIEGNGHACEATAFPEMAHGWVPRGDASDPAVARDVKAALEIASAFLTKHLA